MNDKVVGLEDYLPTGPSRCVSETLWFSSRGMAGDICSVLRCFHTLQQSGESAAAAAAVGGSGGGVGGAEELLDLLSSWSDCRRARCQEERPAPGLPWPEVCRRSGPACSCRGKEADCGCSPRPGTSGRRRTP